MAFTNYNNEINQLLSELKNMLMFPKTDDLKEIRKEAIEALEDFLYFKDGHYLHKKGFKINGN